MVSAIVKAERLEARRESGAGEEEGFAEGEGAEIGGAALRGREQPAAIRSAPRVHGLEMGEEFGVEIDAARLAVFGVSISADGEQAVSEVNVRPSEAEGFLFARTGERKEAEKVRELGSVFGGRASGGDNEVKVCPGEQGARFFFGFHPGQAVGG